MTHTTTALSATTVTAVVAVLRGERASLDPLHRPEIEAIARHGVAPLLYARTHDGMLRAAAMHEAAIEPLREADVREVLAFLGAAGVETLVLKGTALAYDLYEAPELRPRADTDLLIRRERLDAARAAFASAGYAAAVTSGDEHGVRQMAFTRRDAQGIEHEYDVHWAVSNTPLFAHALQFDEVWSRSVPLPRLGPHARGLNRVDALMLACIHRVAHHHDDERLIWLIDIVLLRDRMSAAEHEEFWRRAADRGIVAVCSRSIEQAEALRDGAASDLAADWLPAERISAREPSSAFLDRDITHGGVLVANLRALSAAERVRRLWQLAFPPAEFMRKSFGVRSGFALPFLYAVRAARGVIRLFRRVAS